MQQHASANAMHCDYSGLPFDNIGFVYYLLKCIGWRNQQEGCAVRCHFLLITVARAYLRHILLAPDIADGNLVAPQTERAGCEAYLLRLSRCVEKTYSQIAVLKNLYIDHITVSAEIGDSTHASRVLTDVVHLVIAQETEGEIIHLSYIAANEEG
jgi:hypothetical protein